jgi:hypothetical protein
MGKTKNTGGITKVNGVAGNIAKYVLLSRYILQQLTRTDTRKSSVMFLKTTSFFLSLLFARIFFTPHESGYLAHGRTARFKTTLIF